VSHVNEIVFECVDSALSNLDFVDKRVFYEYLKSHYDLDFQKFAENFEVVHAALEGVYGIDHFKIERILIRKLNEHGQKGSYPRFDEVQAFGIVVNVLMAETEKNLEKNKSTLQVSEYTKCLEQKINETNQRLKQSERLAAIGETAAMVGHDIRNPLQAIIGELYLQRQDVDLLPEGSIKSGLQESIKAIEDNVFYVNKIVSDLQDFAKPLKAEEAEEEVNFNAVLEDALTIVPIPNNLQVELTVEKNFPTVRANYPMLKRILTNLIMNAVQAMPKGGKLTITAKRLGDKAEIAVQDSGEGIPEEVKAKLFKPLFTTKSKGQGLGLAVVKRLVETQGGSVGFESETGRGAKFYIHLPVTSQRLNKNGQPS
jgi:signal transduction histidine kinase